MVKKANWNFPTTIWFGPNRIKEIGQACKVTRISHPLVVTDEGLIQLPLMAEFLAELTSASLPHSVFSKVSSNPTNQNVIDGVAVYKRERCDGVIALGGGSALDAGKTIAFMVAQTRPVWDFEDVGDNYLRATLEGVPPIIAVPTTSGTGSEVGRATVITDKETHTKKIIFHPLMLPKIALLDPCLTYDLPPHITAWTGLDALTHALEAYLAKGYHPMADGIALEAISMIHTSLVKAYESPHDEQARSQMMVASSMGATAFQKGLGSVHSVAHQLGGRYDTPHGLANAVILPYALKQNQLEIAAKLLKISRFLELDNRPEAFIDEVIALRKKLNICNSLKEVNESLRVGLQIKKQQAKEIGEGAFLDPSTSTNAKSVTAKDLEDLFLNSFEGKV